LENCRNTWGMTWWCSHDVDSRYVGMDPLEYGMGLLDTHNNIKPVGARIASLITQFRTNPVQRVMKHTALVLPDGLISSKDTPQDPYPGWHFARRYMALVKDGVTPAIVLQSRAADKSALAARGITELITM